MANTKSNILSGPRAKLIVSFDPNDTQSQAMIISLDKALGILSGADRLDITAISDRAMKQQFDMMVPSIAIYKGGKLLGSTTVKTDRGISNFLNKLKKEI